MLTGPQAAEGTGEQVHEAEQRCHRGSFGRGQAEEVFEVAGGGVVDSQLHTEASGVLGEHEPRVEVQVALQ